MEKGGIKKNKIEKNSDVTIKDIARATGKSYATVSKALNSKFDVSEVTRTQILDKSLEMGYRPNSMARALVLKRSNTIGLIIPDVMNPFFADIIYSIDEYVTSCRYNLIISNTNWQKKSELDRLEILLQMRVDGIIVKASSENNNQHFSYLGIPVVFLSSGADDTINAQSSFVDYDDVLGGFLATEHLIKSGYKRIAYISCDWDTISFNSRLKGFKKALEQYGVEKFDEYIVNGKFTVQSGAKSLKKLLNYPKPPDAVFCGNDMIALGVLQAVIESGLKVPMEFGIVGYDNISFAAFPQIQLTTISQPRINMGQIAAKILVDEIKRFPNAKPQKILLKPYLIVRKTTGKKIN